MPTSLTLGGLVPVLASQPAASGGGFAPILAAVVFVGGAAALALSSPMVARHLGARRDDARAFRGNPPAEQTPDTDEGSDEQSGEMPVWGNLDFAIYRESSDPPSGSDPP